MKKVYVLLISLLILLACVGCGCKHDWQDATCTKPKTCSKCGETEGDPNGHVWAKATCTEPETCYNCGQKQGSPLAHVVISYETKTAASCTTQGVEVGVCQTCGKEQSRVIDAIGHNYQQSKRVEPTCQKAGVEEKTCTNCKDVISTELEKVDHNYSDWKVSKQATESAAGTKERVCSVCKNKETESYELTEKEKREFRAQKGIVSGKTASNKAAEVTIKSVAFKSSVGNRYFNEKSKYGTFYVVTFTFKNISKEADYLYYGDFNLILDGYEYEPSWDAIWAGICSNENYLSNENVNPNCSLTTSIIFDIPKEIATNPDLQLRVSAGGLFDGFVKVNIYE